MYSILLFHVHSSSLVHSGFRLRTGKPASAYLATVFGLAFPIDNPALLRMHSRYVCASRIFCVAVCIYPSFAFFLLCHPLSLRSKGWKIVDICSQSAGPQLGPPPFAIGFCSVHPEIRITHWIDSVGINSRVRIRKNLHFIGLSIVFEGRFRQGRSVFCGSDR